MKGFWKSTVFEVIVCVLCSGCGSNVSTPLLTPTIIQVTPQTISAGASGLVMTVKGSSFDTNSTILWSGHIVQTQVIDSTTLTVPVSSAAVASPAVVQIQVQNGSGAESSTVPVSIVGNGQAAPSPLAITSSTLANGQAGSAYTAILQASGGTPGYTWSLRSGSLPAGLSLSAGGVISGTPTAAGTFSFTVQVTDSGSPAQTQSATASITVAAPSPAVGTSTDPTSTQSTTVTNLGTITANQVENSLGFQIGQSAEWEYQYVAASGATFFRSQDCAWSNVGQQSAALDNTALYSSFALTSSCSNMLLWAAKYNLHPIEVAAYGPPSHPLLDLTLLGAANVGTTSLSVTFQDGSNGASISNLRAFYDYISNPNTGNFVNIGTGIGAMIDDVTITSSTTATITLASAVTTAQPAGTQLQVNEVLYPPIPDEDPTAPGIAEYAAYVQWLANEMASSGLTGYIEIWNEPPWSDSLWACRGCNYDYQSSGAYSSSTSYGLHSVVTENGTPYISLITSNTGNDPASSPSDWSSTIPSNAYTTVQTGYQFGFAAALQSITLPSDVKLIWAGTNKTSGGSIVYLSSMQTATGVALAEPVVNFASESIHPYSDTASTPEAKSWLAPCLAGDIRYEGCPAVNPPDNSGENFWQISAYTQDERAINPSYGLPISITETNDIDQESTPAANALQLNGTAVMRQFLAFAADGASPISFYEMCSGDSPTDYGMTMVSTGKCTGSDNTITTKPAYTSLQGLIADLAPLSNVPISAYSSATLASVTNYRGTYNLASMHMVGARAGASANSDVLAIWQITSAEKACSQCWWHVASPTGGSATISIPAGMQITSAIDTVTRTAVSYSTSGQTATLAVSDNPIELIIDPVMSTVR